MDELEFCEVLRLLIEQGSDEGELDVRRIETFEEAMLLTNNRGLVVRLQDGSEYQLQVVRSR